MSQGNVQKPSPATQILLAEIQYILELETRIRGVPPPDSMLMFGRVD